MEHAALEEEEDRLGGDGGVRRLAQGHPDSQLGGAGIELATFWLPANPLYLLGITSPGTRVRPAGTWQTQHSLGSCR